jgi:hypothetical protein
MPATLRALDPPLGNYLRPGRNDHTVIQQLLSESRLSATGLVIDPTLIARQEDLAHEAGRQGIETVLDPRSVDLSTPAGFLLSGVSGLSWAPGAPHVAEELSGASGLLLAEALAEFAVANVLSAVLAPTHIIANTDDPWLLVDAELVGHLRRALDARGRTKSPIYYPLVLRSQMLYDEQERQRLIAHLEALPIDAVWLRVHPFGTTTSGPLALRRYIHACRDLHQLEVPLIAEHTGTVGLPLLAFGAVGGIESGVTLGERFSLDRYTRVSEGAGYLPPPRVYVSGLGAMLSRAQARSLFSKRGMRAAHGCQDQRCCPHGWEDSIANPRRHFVVQRGSEIDRLTGTPAELRPTIYLNDVLRPASDAAIRAAAAEPALEPVRKRLDSWRATLGSLLISDPPQTYSTAPTGHRVGVVGS